MPLREPPTSSASLSQRPMPPTSSSDAPLSTDASHKPAHSKAGAQHHAYTPKGPIPMCSTVGSASGKKKSHDHRERYPEVDALVQLVLRVICFFLHVGTIAMAKSISMKAFYFEIKTIYKLCGFCMILCAIEIFSLMDPHMPKLPRSFPQITRCPRLPSFWLALLEAAALGMVLWGMIILLQPPLDNDTTGLRSPDCPPDTCMVDEDYQSINAYTLLLICMVIDIGFLVMSLTHWGKRVVPKCLYPNGW